MSNLPRTLLAHELSRTGNRRGKATFDRAVVSGVRHRPDDLSLFFMPCLSGFRDSGSGLPLHVASSLDSLPPPQLPHQVLTGLQSWRNHVVSKPRPARSRIAGAENLSPWLAELLAL